MDKSLLIFILFGVGALYLLTNFIGDIQAEDDTHSNNGYKVEQKYEQYQKVDSIGRPILVVDNADEKIQVAAWNASTVKVEFLEFFPNYTEMKTFVKERVRGNALQKKLIRTIDDVEGKFFSGSMSVEQAKRALDPLK